MKLILSLAFLLFLELGFTQEIKKIQLSDSLMKDRLGLWESGKYKIYIELDVLEEKLRYLGNNYGYDKDSVSQTTSRRYLKAANELKNANNGYDLQQLIVYYGIENETLNKGPSKQVSNMVQALLKEGQAAVYKNGKRIYELNEEITPGGGGIGGRNHIIYHRKKKNIVFQYHSEWGW